MTSGEGNRTSQHPPVKKSKGAPRGSLKRTILIIAIPAAILLFVISSFATSYHPSPPLGAWEASQLHLLYTTYPTINTTATLLQGETQVSAYLSANPAFNFGEMTANDTEALLGGLGVVEIHSLTAAQVSNSSVSAANNHQPGTFFFVAIQHIHTPQAAVIRTCVTSLPDPSLFDAFACMGISYS